MPMKSNRGSFPTMADMVRREDEIRKASIRAEARMMHDNSQAGGLEGAKRHSLAIHKWQQEQLKQELHNIKNSYKKTNALMMQNPDNLKHMDPQFAEDLEEQEYIASQNPEEDSSRGTAKVSTSEDTKFRRYILPDYGRNYFGYKSQPGTNKPHFDQMKAIKDKYSTVKNYYEYQGPKQMDKQTREKLRKQKLENDKMREKVKSFGASDKPTKVAGYQAPVDSKDVMSQVALDKIHEDDVDKRETKNLPTTTMIGQENSENVNRVASEENASKSGQPAIEITDGNIIQLPPQIEPQPTRRGSGRPSSPTSSHRNFETSSTIGSRSTLTLPPYRTSKPKTALDLVFDANTYAPDGRLRKVHCLPDTDKAFREARQARYVRTKYKREIDRELSINEIFGR